MEQLIIYDESREELDAQEDVDNAMAMHIAERKEDSIPFLDPADYSSFH